LKGKWGAVMRNQNEYGYCSECGAELIAVWFTDIEYELVGGVWLKTGRTKQAVSHLECEICGHRECVDDSFDGPWR
jgi:hypothetical protein